MPRDGAGLRETLVRRAVSAHALTRLRGATLPALLLIAAIVSLRVAPGPAGVCGAFLAACMLAIAAVDARRFLIPDALTASAFAAGALAALLGGADAGAQQLACALLRAAAAALPFLLLMTLYRRWRGREGLGLGDVKLAAVAGVWLDWTAIAGAVELAALSALAAYALRSLIRRTPMRASAAMPFGLFLAPSIWLAWLAERLLT